MLPRISIVKKIGILIVVPLIVTSAGLLLLGSVFGAVFAGSITRPLAPVWPGRRTPWPVMSAISPSPV